MPEQPYICIFSALYKPSTGGVEIVTENLAKKLVELGHKVIVVTSNTHGLPPKATEDGVEILRLPCKPLLNGRLPIPERNDEFKQLLDELEQMPIDSILINTRFYPHSRIAAEFAEKRGIKPIVLDHGSAYLTLGNTLVDTALKTYEHWMTRQMKKHPADYYGISKASAHWLATFGIEAKGTLNNAMDARAFIQGASDRNLKAELSLPEDAFIVAFTGRLVPEKGVAELIAAAQLLEDEKGIHFILAGDGPLMGLMEDAPANVHALGNIPREDIAALLLQADAFCLPTRSEGFSTSLLEAAICECAPIITNVGGVAELIPDESFGIVIPNKEPQTIVNAIQKLHDDPEDCKATSQRIARHASSTFTWDRTAQNVLVALGRASTGSV